MEKEFSFKKWSDMAVKVHSRKERQVENHLLRGRALLCPEEAEFTFVENEPRGARSTEVGRTVHSRFVRRPDGAYTVTFRFLANEKYLQSSLIAEIRDVVKGVLEDHKRQKNDKFQNQKGGEYESK